MTAPRRVLPNSFGFITRRVTQRCYLLRPDETTNAIFDYCLAEAASRFRIKLIAWKVLSNHYHLVYFDAEGNAPAFAEHLHKMVAKVMNCRLHRHENFWSTEPTCITHLPTLADVFDKVVYTLANSVTANLVEYAAEWPGSHSYSYLDGKETLHERPVYYFSPKGVMPEQVTLKAELPPGAPATWAEDVRRAVAEREAAARTLRAETGSSILGVEKVLATRLEDSPKTDRDVPYRKIRPVLACKEKERRHHELTMLRQFRIAYAQAREAFRTGDRTVMFPRGTYRLRLTVGVNVVGEPLMASVSSTGGAEIPRPPEIVIANSNRAPPADAPSGIE